MKNLKKSIRKLKRRKTKSRKTYKGGAAAEAENATYTQEETILHSLFTTKAISIMAFFLSTNNTLREELTQLIKSEKYTTSNDIKQKRYLLDLLHTHGITINQYFTPELLNGSFNKKDLLDNIVDEYMYMAQKILYSLFKYNSKKILRQYLNRDIISEIYNSLNDKDDQTKKQLILGAFKKKNITISNETFLPTLIEPEEMDEPLPAQMNKPNHKLYKLAKLILSQLNINNLLPDIEINNFASYLINKE